MSEKVSIVKCDSYDEDLVYKKVKEALNLIDFEGIKKGSKVLLKPNIILPKEPEKAATTHPSIINAVCRILKENNTEIWIGDSSGSLLFGGTRKAFGVSGIERIAKKWNAKLIYFETSKVISKNINGKILKKVEIAEPVLTADYVINLPKLKTHRFTKFTCAIKNLFGCIPGGRKRSYHGIAISEKRFGDLLIDIYQQLKVDLTIVDAIVGMEGDGPTAGGIKKTGLILASSDCVAVDVVASSRIGFKPKEIYYINSAIKRGLCPEIEIVGEKGIKVRYKKPINLIGRVLPDFIRDRIESTLVPEVRIAQEVCKKCMICFNACPQKAIKVLDNPKRLKINQKKCIHCYCCHELCPHKAVMLRDSFIVKVVKKIFKYSE